jgi:3-oxoacyl-[acyl-carrier protein] reductase
MKASGRPFESINPGDEATVVRQITSEDVKRFAELTGDDNPLHVDRAFAESTPYKDVVVHGMLGASLLSTLIGTELPGTGAVWISQAFEFLHPVRIDDTLTVTGTVTKKHERERLLELDARIVNQANVIVLSGKGIVRVMAPPVEPAESVLVRPMVAIVTGGAGGIGRAICRSLARDGFAVVVGSRAHEERAAAIVDEIEVDGGKAMAVGVDVTDEAAVRSMVASTVRRFGGIGAIVHAASPAIGVTSFDDLEWPAIEMHINTDVRGAFNLAKACVPRMRAQGYGRFVVITSGELDRAPTPHWTAYGVGKAALAMFSRSLAVEVGPFGINVNSVSPGMTETALVGDLSERARLVLARQAPLRRLAQPDDIAKVVSFLVSDRADYITGETIHVNGGQTTL